jgi:antitoxin (DNA-binding transcriptional repressor) of toxin-antitoxin stability system
VITRHGRSVAQLTGLQAPTRQRRLGLAHGRFTLPG